MLPHWKWLVGLAAAGGGVFAFLHFKKKKAGTAPQLAAAPVDKERAKIMFRLKAAVANDKAKGLPAPPQGWELLATQLGTIAADGSKSAITSNAAAIAKMYPASAAMLAHHAIAAPKP